MRWFVAEARKEQDKAIDPNDIPTMSGRPPA
jgi:hypothetical protein